MNTCDNVQTSAVVWLLFASFLPKTLISLKIDQLFLFVYFVGFSVGFLLCPPVGVLLVSTTIIYADLCRATSAYVLGFSCVAFLLCELNVAQSAYVDHGLPVPYSYPRP